MEHNPKAVANAFLTLAREAGKTLTPMKLQKLIYFAHGWYLGLTGEPLINEPVQAWDYGPVIPSVYHEFKQYGRDAIACPAWKIIDAPDGEMTVEPYDIGNDERAKSVIKKIWEVYGELSAVQLSNLTHEDGTPWAQTWNGHSGLARGLNIENKLIQEHFAEKVRANRRAREVAA